MYKRIFALLAILCICLTGCSSTKADSYVVTGGNGADVDFGTKELYDAFINTGDLYAQLRDLLSDADFGGYEFTNDAAVIKLDATNAAKNLNDVSVSGKFQPLKNDLIQIFNDEAEIAETIRSVSKYNMDTGFQIDSDLDPIKSLSTDVCDLQERILTDYQIN